jgi:hypothetical protein
MIDEKNVIYARNVIYEGRSCVGIDIRGDPPQFTLPWRGRVGAKRRGGVI